MTDNASLTHRLVLINKWAALLGVTLKAGFVSAQKSKAAGFKRLLNIRRRAFGRDPFVRLMAIAANDRARSAASFDVQTPRTVARLATHVLCVFPFRLQSRVSGCSEIPHDLFVAGGAFF